ncbi:MAG: glycosyltransferase family 2 protein [bacterium]|nr:glycosyltransferase family 2 protein [bacterium]
MITKILKKIKYYIKKMFIYIKKAWVKYHFMIPLSVWKNFFRKYKTPIFINPDNERDYNRWIKKNKIKSKYKKLEYNPLISVVIPVYNVDPKHLKACLKSILSQSYKNFEICIADDNSTNKDTITTLKKFEKKYKNIKVVYRKTNGHISRASNSALRLAKGEFIAMIDNDDIISKYAFYEMVKVLNDDKTIDFIYTDEDKVDLNGVRKGVHFKADYSPDTLLSCNYFCHLTLLRTSILKKIGGWKPGYEGAQDHDLFLRFVEQTDKIYHIPKVLYTWRMVEGSTSISIDNKSYAIEAEYKTLKDTLKRRNLNAIIHHNPNKLPNWIEYKFKGNPKVSIIIPAKEKIDVLTSCIDSIYSKTTYKNFEIIIVDNGSKSKKTFNEYNKLLKCHDNIKLVNADIEFNYSKLNNIGVENSNGEYLLFLNNDTKVITPNWLEIMIGYASLSHIGAVGAKLYFEDNTIQSAGIVLSYELIAADAFKHYADGPGLYGRFILPYNYSAVCGACLMVSKEKYLNIAGWNEELKIAYNDVDFCLRLLKKGYYNVLVPTVSLYHFESLSRGQDSDYKKVKRLAQEQAYMRDHWKDLLLRDPFYNDNYVKINPFMLTNSKHR